jgi:putative sigma-54 modulation protein
MQIAVTFRHMEASEGIKDYVTEKVGRLQKYAENPREVHVVLSVEKFRQIAEITMIADGSTLNSQGRNSDLYAAIDQMVEKMERQLRERREKGRRIRPNSSSPKGALGREEIVSEEKAETDLLPIIQKRRTLVRPMSLEEAAAQLSLSKKDLLVFINSESGQVNVLCRLKDGSYEWVEPRLK